MKSVLLLSDTHGYLNDRILHYINKADVIIHAGDVGTIDVLDKIKSLKPTIAVYGNIDGTELRQDLPLEVEFDIEGIKFYMIHIGGYPNRYKPGIEHKLLRYKPDVFICGHSHILKVMHDKKLNLLHLNPGAAGNKGFHKMRTMIRFHIEDTKIQNLEVIELGKR